jgi:tRNA (guanine-N7-)-methyltransferase
MRSYARIVGKGLDKEDQSKLKERIEKVKMRESIINDIKNKDIILEIGFGMGDNFINLISNEKFALNNQNKFFIGAEPFLNGHKRILNALENYNNYALWDQDVNELITILPDNFLTQVFILFPDPWPKKKQNKRRLFQKDWLLFISSKIQHNGQIFFASDDKNYIDFAIEQINLFNKEAKSHSLIYNMSQEFYEGYQKTKYHKRGELLQKEINVLDIKIKIL